MRLFVSGSIALGFLTSVVVAIAIGRIGHRQRGLPSPTAFWPPEASTSWVYVPSDVRNGCVSVTLIATPGPLRESHAPRLRAIRDPALTSLSRAPSPELVPRRGTPYMRTELLSGWPLLSNAMYFDHIPDQPTEVKWGVAVGYQPIHSGVFRGLPLRPLWWGTLFNTAVYALIWYPVLRTASRATMGLRKGRRSRLGRCVTKGCGYQLEGLAVCPECGVAQGEVLRRGSRVVDAEPEVAEGSG